MNDEVKDYIGTINEKVRTQHDGVENTQSADTECPCTSTRSIQHNLQVEALSPCTIMNGAAINNLNRSSSNGYNIQCQENTDNFGSQNGQGGKDSDTARRNSLYRNIYYTSSSDDDDNEHCVYTYKGAEVGSDLPESFFHLGVNEPNGRDRASRCSSPEMDFLEMDFDPGPSNGQDSDSDNASLPQNFSSNEHINEMYTDHQEFGIIDTIETDNSYPAGCDENANCYSNKMPINAEVVSACSESNSSKSFLQKPLTIDYMQPCCSKSLNSNECDADNVKYTVQLCRWVPARDLLASSSDEEGLNDDQSQFYIDRGIRKNSLDSNREAVTVIPSFNPDVTRHLKNIRWVSIDVSSIDEDDLISYEDLLPLDPSYSISAIFNVMVINIRIWRLIKLGTSHSDESDREKLISLLRPKQIPENVPLVEYLFMRAVQNANEIDLVHFAATVLRDQLHSRFFATYPEKRFNLFDWLNYWMRKGAIPVVTRNIEERRAPVNRNILNPWRHNVVYKMEAPYVYLSNPLERVIDGLLKRQLSKPPVIYVKPEHILEKWHSKVDLRSLTRANHNRWYNENVLGQVATIIREDNGGSQTMKDVCVPCNCQCGITLFVPSENTELCKELDEAFELPAW